MTRSELLELLVAHARSNGFAFRKWYTGRLQASWNGASDAVKVLSEERRYYALLFSHDFAESFWKAGKPMTFQVSAQQFPRRRNDGTVGMVQRKGYTRRMARSDAWRYHLREMALAEEPLRYIRKFLPILEDLEPDPGSPFLVSSGDGPDPRFIVDPEDLLEDED